MRREEVQQRLDAFLALLQQENELKEELVALQMHGRKATDQDLDEKLRLQQELIDAIDALRHQHMLPILEEIAGFIARARGGHVV